LPNPTPPHINKGLNSRPEIQQLRGKRHAMRLLEPTTNRENTYLGFSSVGLGRLLGRFSGILDSIGSGQETSASPNWDAIPFSNSNVDFNRMTDNILHYIRNGFM